MSQFMSLGAILGTLIIVILGYRFYARKMDRDIIQADPKRATPAKMYNDGVDFMPASGSVLFGYQFKSIAALGPIVGPITALQFGWAPALAWLIVGVFFIGWVQDYASAMLAMRNEGMTMGGLSYKLISPRARTLLLSFLYIYLLLIMSAFGSIVAGLLGGRADVPVGFLIIILAGVLAGQMTYRWKQDLLLTTVVTVAIALVGVWLGTLPIFSGSGQEGQTLGIVTAINHLAGDPQNNYVLYKSPYEAVKWSYVLWALIAMGVCYLGSVLPIWRFAQPVNYTSFWFVAISVVLAIVGVVIATFIVAPGSSETLTTAFQLPAFTTAMHPVLGPIWPILFVTIACGAISGWHSLVSTSGTARQLEKETDVLPVGAGAMYTEAILAVLAVIMGATLITTSATAADGTVTYQGFNPANFTLTFAGGPAGVFAAGMARFMNVLGIPLNFGAAVGSIFLTVMALTVLQLVLRFMRVASSELLGEKIPLFKNMHFGSLVAILLALFLVYFGFWQALWVMFGSANQLFAGLALLLITIWLAGQKKPYGWTLVPGAFMYITTVAALLWTAWARFQRGFLTPQPATSTVAPIFFQLAEALAVILGLYMAISALVLLWDGIKAFLKARSAAAPSPAAGD